MSPAGGRATPVSVASTAATTPITLNTMRPSATTIVASAMAGRSGRPRGVMMPSWSFEESREERMPPIAPA